jgi:hypothetical protein
MYAISLLKHVLVVLSKSEGLQKWLAPCGTYVHRDARTIDVSILEKDSYRQYNMIIGNEVLRARTWKILRNICLFTWAIEAFIAYFVDFCHILHQSGSACMKQLTRASKMKAPMASMASCETMVDTSRVSAFTRPANMSSIPVHMLSGGSASTSATL